MRNGDRQQRATNNAYFLRVDGIGVTMARTIYVVVTLAFNVVSIPAWHGTCVEICISLNDEHAFKLVFRTEFW